MNFFSFVMIVFVLLCSCKGPQREEDEREENSKWGSGVKMISIDSQKQALQALESELNRVSKETTPQQSSALEALLRMMKEKKSVSTSARKASYSQTRAEIEGLVEESRGIQIYSKEIAIEDDLSGWRIEIKMGFNFYGAFLLDRGDLVLTWRIPEG